LNLQFSSNFTESVKYKYRMKFIDVLETLCDKSQHMLRRMAESSKRKDSNVGYVHSLSPIKKVRSGKLYYNFDLQTSPTKFTRVVGFDKNLHA
ncbi:unnamed protein product, partial [Porites evermanni]